MVDDDDRFTRALTAILAQGRGHTWSMFEEMQVYFRVGPKMIDKKLVTCVQLANLSLHRDWQHKGCFTRLVACISQVTDLPIYLEQVVNTEFLDALMARHGWKPARTHDGQVWDLWLPKENAQ